MKSFRINKQSYKPMCYQHCALTIHTDIVQSYKAINAEKKSFKMFSYESKIYYIFFSFNLSLNIKIFFNFYNNNMKLSMKLNETKKFSIII